MNIIMNKLKENEIYIEYQIEAEIPVTTIINKKGKECVVVRQGYAYCKFNKHTEEFTLDNEKSDPYFLIDSRSIVKAQCKLIKLARECAPFTNLIQIASG